MIRIPVLQGLPWWLASLYGLPYIRVTLGSDRGHIRVTPVYIVHLMFSDLQIDGYDFSHLNLDDILSIAPLYRSTNLNYLAKLVKKKLKGIS